MRMIVFNLFFFQAEDGIRDIGVTGVQTCALPISLGAPLRVLDLHDERARALYERDLLLLRPDLHVAWRGNRAPQDPAALARLVTGHQIGRASCRERV